MFGVKRPGDERFEAGDSVGFTPNDSGTTDNSANGSGPNGSGPNGGKAAAAAAAVADAGHPPVRAGSQPPGSDSQPHETGSNVGRPSARNIVLGTAAAAAMTAGVVFALTQPSPTQPGPP